MYTIGRPLRSHSHSMIVRAAIVVPVGSAPRHPTLERSNRSVVVDRSSGSTSLLSVEHVPRHNIQYLPKPPT